MDKVQTLIILAAAAAVAVGAGWMGARPPNVQRGPRMIPWRAIMVAAAVTGLLMLVHLINLNGVPTGR